jgi:hypothetical protein
MVYVGIDWAYRRAAWCAKSSGGEIQAEGVTPADEDGLAKLVLALGQEVTACVEMMSGAVWVRDSLRSAGWRVDIADARKVKAVARLACKTDKSAWTAAHLRAMKCLLQGLAAAQATSLG